MIEAFIGVGSNLDHPADQVRKAVAALEQPPQLHCLGCSSLYETDPVGYLDQPRFINAVAQVQTTLTAHQLLDRLRAIEAHQGRQRSIPNGPRTVDLDLLLFGDQIIRDHQLTVPHPRMAERAFVLLPLAELAPKANIPGVGEARQLLAAISAQGVVRLPS
jgi:2-amino-4-hydroxy-6-hydroxymethyldihydropteridine diphosphokinase